jgi:hypothetical protein
MNIETEEKYSLIQVVGDLLIPALEKNGFRCSPSGSTRIKAHELRPHFPLGILHRLGPTGLDVAEPYFLGRHKFVLHAARIPLGGIETVMGHSAAEDCLATWNSTWFTLYSCPFFLIPFSAAKFFGGSALRSDVERVVRGVVDLLPEVEAALNDGITGRHLKRVSR